MKKYSNYLLSSLLLIVFAACEDVSDNAIPHTAAPALILVDGGPTFSADQAVAVTVEFRELRKSGVRIDTLGAAPNVQQIDIEVTNDNGLSVLQEGISLSDGIATYQGTWEAVLGTTPEPGMSARLEFAGTSTDGIPFRKYYTVAVE